MIIARILMTLLVFNAVPAKAGICNRIYHAYAKLIPLTPPPFQYAERKIISGIDFFVPSVADQIPKFKKLYDALALTNVKTAEDRYSATNRIFLNGDAAHQTRNTVTILMYSYSYEAKVETVRLKLLLEEDAEDIELVLTKAQIPFQHYGSGWIGFRPEAFFDQALQNDAFVERITRTVTSGLNRI